MDNSLSPEPRRCLCFRRRGLSHHLGLWRRLRCLGRRRRGRCHGGGGGNGACGARRATIGRSCRSRLSPIAGRAFSAAAVPWRVGLECFLHTPVRRLLQRHLAPIGGAFGRLKEGDLPGHNDLWDVSLQLVQGLPEKGADHNGVVHENSTTHVRADEHLSPHPYSSGHDRLELQLNLCAIVLEFVRRVQGAVAHAGIHVEHGDATDAEDLCGRFLEGVTLGASAAENLHIGAGNATIQGDVGASLLRLPLYAKVTSNIAMVHGGVKHFRLPLDLLQRWKKRRHRAERLLEGMAAAAEHAASHRVRRSSIHRDGLSACLRGLDRGLHHGEAVGIKDDFGLRTGSATRRTSWCRSRPTQAGTVDHILDVERQRLALERIAAATQSLCCRKQHAKPVKAIAGAVLLPHPIVATVLLRSPAQVLRYLGWASHQRLLRRENGVVRPEEKFLEDAHLDNRVLHTLLERQRHHDEGKRQSAPCDLRHMTLQPLVRQEDSR
mmetsp:Transcript_8010/g.16864  ORF Transcript_8010/g.16864 Transcript_8010/m.16864 type:complete len:493 (-) Transcript_8010:1163-2641(-)